MHQTLNWVDWVEYEATAAAATVSDFATLCASSEHRWTICCCCCCCWSTLYAEFFVVFLLDVIVVVVNVCCSRACFTDTLTLYTRAVYWIFATHCCKKTLIACRCSVDFFSYFVTPEELVLKLYTRSIVMLFAPTLPRFSFYSVLDSFILFSVNFQSCETA